MWVVLVMKNLPANVGNLRDVGSILGSGRPPGGGQSNPPQYSCLETEEPGGLQSIGLQRVAYDWSNLSPMHICVIKSEWGVLNPFCYYFIQPYSQSCMICPHAAKNSLYLCISIYLYLSMYLITWLKLLFSQFNHGPCTEEHGRLQSMGSQRVTHDCVTKNTR